jgi:HYR domain-containing protein
VFRRAILILALAVSVVPLVALGADEAIVIVVPADQIVEATSAEGATVSFTATAHKGTTELTVTCLPASGSTFAIQTTDVECSATDGTETAQATFHVTVSDTTGPTVTVPAEITIEASDYQGEVVTFPASASDLVDGLLLPVECTPASGTLFPVGTTHVTCLAADTRHNEGSAAFDVTVYEGDPPPVITLPADMTVEAESFAGASVGYPASAVDWRNRALAVACSPPSLTVLGIGVTNVICTAQDAYNRISTTGFSVTVVDSRPPVITTSGPQVLSARSRAGSAVNYTVSASDVVDGPVAVKCAPASGALFPVGTTKVSCTAGDRRSNTATKAFQVKVVFTPNRRTRSVAGLSPTSGSRVSEPPTLRWRGARKARFYNVQVFRRGQKVLSAWPTRPRLRLHSQWTFKGRGYRLRPGRYTWLVWPGYGPSAQPRFGKLLLLSSFVFVRR